MLELIIILVIVFTFPYLLIWLFEFSYNNSEIHKLLHNTPYRLNEPNNSPHNLKVKKSLEIVDKIFIKN